MALSNEQLAIKAKVDQMKYDVEILEKQISELGFFDRKKKKALEAKVQDLKNTIRGLEIKHRL